MLLSQVPCFSLKIMIHLFLRGLKMKESDFSGQERNHLQLKKIGQKINRVRLMQNRVKTLERNSDVRRKISLGGLIIKSGLDEETASVILGLLDEAQERLLEDTSLRSYWHMRGARLFEQDEKNG